MAENFDLPSATVNRIVRGLTDNLQLSKESKVALARAASVFVLYLTATSNELCRSEKRASILGKDVLRALELMDFAEFLPVLEQASLDRKAGKVAPKRKYRKRNVESVEGESGNTNNFGEESGAPDQLDSREQQNEDDELDEQNVEEELEEQNADEDMDEDDFEDEEGNGEGNEDMDEEDSADRLHDGENELAEDMDVGEP